MTKQANKRKSFFANKLHRTILLLVLVASLLPSVLITILLYYLIFGITAEQMGIPEAIAYTIIPAARRVEMILYATAPIVILIILFYAYRITHAIIGPYDRILRELDEHLAGRKKEHIVIRKSDKFRPLVDRINRLLDRG